MAAFGNSADHSQTGAPSCLGAATLLCGRASYGMSESCERIVAHCSEVCAWSDEGDTNAMASLRKAPTEPALAVVTTGTPPPPPKGALTRLSIGQSFAENDKFLEDADTYVLTPAYNAALNFASSKYFFVGRRGTGKTALRRYFAMTGEHPIVVVPEIFAPGSTLLDVSLFKQYRQRHFRALVTAFRRTILAELLIAWRRDHPERIGLPDALSAELTTFSNLDFDTRALQYISRILRPLKRVIEVDRG
jgi:hypothetical protein